MRGAGRGLGELLLAAAACVGALWFAYPLAFSQASTHLWSHTADPYALGDLAGSIYMTVRRSIGELGCAVTTHGFPWSFDLCMEIPNPVVTDLLGDVVARLGMPLGYNLGVLGMLASNGVAVFLVARLLGASMVASLLGAVAAAIAPSVIYEVEGGYVQHVWWAPAIAGLGLAVASVERWGRFRLVLPAAAMLALAVPVYAMNPFMLLPWALLQGLVILAMTRKRPGGLRGGMARSILGAAICGAAVYPFVASGLDSAGPRLFEGSVSAYNLNLGLEAFTPSDWFSMEAGSGRLMRSPGLLLWGAVVAAVLTLRHAWRWAPAMFGAMLLLGISFGPTMDGGSGSGAYNDGLPYVLMMEHMPIARGSMRPARYGVAAAFLLALALPLALTGIREWLKRERRWIGGRRGVAIHALIVAGLALGILLQVRPTRVSPSLEWPPEPELIELEGLRVDLPIVGKSEDRFAWWAFSPAPRLNPPHDIERWRDRIVVEGHHLTSALVEIGKGRRLEGDEVAVINRGTPELDDFGLRWAVIHRNGAGQTLQGRWIELLEQVGAVRREVTARHIIYEFPED